MLRNSLIIMPLFKTWGLEIKLEWHESQHFYYLYARAPPRVLTACTVAVAPQKIHGCLCHLSLDNLKKIVLNLSNISKLECQSCQLGKHTHV